MSGVSLFPGPTGKIEATEVLLDSNVVSTLRIRSPRERRYGRKGVVGDEAGGMSVECTRGTDERRRGVEGHSQSRED